MTHPKRRPIYNLFISTIFISLVASCSFIPVTEPTAPIGIFPTPTSITDIYKTEEFDNSPALIPDEFKPILRATVPPFDLDAVAEAEEAAELALEEELRQTSISIQINATTSTHTISPLIYGVANGSEAYIKELDIPLNSWGGAASSRYNWRLGNAWNSGLSGRYTNTNLGYLGEDAAVDFVQGSKNSSATVHFTLPTIGWVAKDNRILTCSFTNNGICTIGQSSSCQSPRADTDPSITSTPSNVDDIVELVHHLNTHTEGVDLITVMHEPESWGTTHYDVHPTCTTYQEILDIYLAHAVPIKQAFPDIELTGPATCCWTFYWETQAGPSDQAAHGNQLFLPWFLDQLRLHDEQLGQRTFDVLDIHYTPIIGGLDEEQARLRHTAALWNPEYQDEGEIREAIALIPRMKTLIAEHYPDTKLGLGEWSFGADWTINGALAIADSLGIFGRENIYYAIHERRPDPGSPGYYAFKIFTNYNDVGGRFGDLSVPTQSSHPDRISSYAAIDSETGNLHLILVNKLDIFDPKDVELTITGFNPDPIVRQFTYNGPNYSGIEEGIVYDTLEIDLIRNSFVYNLESDTIAHLIFRPKN